jgi:hypothetical protein
MSTSNEADDAEEYEPTATGNQSPTTRIEVTPEELFTPQSLDSDDAQNSDTFGLRVSNVESIIGETFVNAEKPDGEPIATVVDEDSTTPTDYRFADPSDSEASFDREGNFQTDETSTVDGESANTYVEGDVDGEAVVYYNGMSGNRLGRTLDFNGRPFARTTDDGYFTGGLYQIHSEWRDPSNRGQLAGDGKAPRMVRTPRLRDDVRNARILIDVTRYQGGRAYELHVFNADAFESEFGSKDHPTSEIPRDDYGGLDCESELEMPYHDNATDVIADEELWVAPYDGEGWETVTDDSLPFDDGGSDFSVSTSVADDTDDTVDAEDQYTEITDLIVETMEDTEAAHGKEPSEVFNGGIEGVLQSNEDEFVDYPSDEQVEAIRRDVFSRVPWLTTDTLEA